MITTDAAGQIDYLNQAAEQLLGVAAPDALGKLLTEVIALVDENDRRSLGDPVKQCLASKSRVTVGRRGLMISRGGETNDRWNCRHRRSRTSATSSSAPWWLSAMSARCAA